MSDTPPDRLSNNPESKFYEADLLARGIGIRLKGVERHKVEKYCVSEGWVRVAAGKSRDRRGNPLTLKLSGPVEAWYRDAAATDEPAADSADSAEDWGPSPSRYRATGQARRRPAQRR